MTYKKRNRHIEYLCCPHCGGHLMNPTLVYLDMGYIQRCQSCVETHFDEYDVCMTTREYVEQVAYRTEY